MYKSFRDVCNFVVSDKSVQVRRSPTIDISIGFTDPKSMVISIKNDADDLNSVLPVSDKIKSSSTKSETEWRQNKIPENTRLCTSEFLSKRRKDKTNYNKGYTSRNLKEKNCSLYSSSRKKKSGFPETKFDVENYLNPTSCLGENYNKIVFPEKPIRNHNLLSNCEEVISTLNDSGYSTEDWKTNRFTGKSSVLGNESLSTTDILLESKRVFDFERNDVKQKAFNNIGGKSSEILLKNHKEPNVSDLIPNKDFFSSQDKNWRSSDVQAKLASGTSSVQSLGEIIQNKSEIISTGEQIHSVPNVTNASSFKKGKSPSRQGNKTSAPRKSRREQTNKNQNKGNCKFNKVKELPVTCNPGKNFGSPILESKNNSADLSTGHSSQIAVSAPDEFTFKSVSSNNTLIKDTIYTYEILKRFGVLPRKYSSVTNSSVTETKAEADPNWDMQSQEFATAQSVISSPHTITSIMSEEVSAQLLVEENGAATSPSRVSAEHPENTSEMSIVPLDVSPEAERDCMKSK